MLSIIQYQSKCSQLYKCHEQYLPNLKRSRPHINTKFQRLDSKAIAAPQASKPFANNLLSSVACSRSDSVIHATPCRSNSNQCTYACGRDPRISREILTPQNPGTSGFVIPKHHSLIPSISLLLTFGELGQPVIVKHPCFHGPLDPGAGRFRKIVTLGTLQRGMWIACAMRPSGAVGERARLERSS